MAIIHCDYTNGDDTTGDGSSGTPYKTLTKAFAVLTNADSIKIANTSAQQESNLAFPAVSFSTETPLIIEGWDNGGALEFTTPTGSYTDVGFIENSGTTNPLFSNTISHVKFVKIKFVNYYSQFWANAKTNVSFFKCYFDTCAFLGQLSTGCGMAFCHYEGADTSNVMEFTGSGTACIGNFITNTGPIVLQSGALALNNIFGPAYSGTLSRIAISTGDYIKIIGNTFIGRNYGDATTDRGIDISSGNSETHVIYGNHFQDFNGSASIAIRCVGAPTTRGTFNILGGNSFYNCTTKYDTNVVNSTVCDFTGEDITDSTDPLEDVASLDFRKTSSADSNVPIAFLDYVETITPSNIIPGAPQNAQGGGGGGDTESSYAGV